MAQWRGYSPPPPKQCYTWVEFDVGSRPCFESYSPSCPVFLSSPQFNTSKFQLDLETVDEEPLCGNVTAHSRFYSHYFKLRRVKLCSNLGESVSVGIEPWVGVAVVFGLVVP